MGLEITAYSRLRHVDGEADLELVQGDFDRLDGRPEGSYALTTDADVWWRAEHGVDLPQSERARTDERVAALHDGLRPECPGDLAVLGDARVVSAQLELDGGSFNRWRDTLCRMVNGGSREDLWGDPDRHGRPFAELMMFSDGEGVIGPDTSAKLAKDFAFYELHCVSCAQQSDDEAFVAMYEDLRAAFELAAQDGFVIFH